MPQNSSSVLSVPRGAGKSTLFGAISLACVVPEMDELQAGPLVESMSECSVIAASFSQGRHIMSHCKQFIKPWLKKDKRRFRILDTQNFLSISDRETEASVKVLPHNSSTISGLQSKIILVDEISKFNLNSINLTLAVLEGARGKMKDSKILYIGTQAASEDHPFQKIISEQADYAQVHCAEEQDDFFDKNIWFKSNPGLEKHFVDLLPIIERESALAQKDSMLLSRFKNYRLNMPVSEVYQSTSMLLEAGTWKSIEVNEIDTSGEYIAGIDMGVSTSMSAVCAYFIESKFLDGLGVFASEPGPAERGINDSVGPLYSRMLADGDLILSEGLISKIDDLLFEMLRRWGPPKCIIMDSWRAKEMRQRVRELAASGHFPSVDIVERRQGFQSQGEDCRTFQAACLTGKVKPKRCLLFRAGMESARVVQNEAGWSKLSKKSMRCRDDIVVASVLAVGLAERLPKPRPEFDIIGCKAG